MKITTVYKKKIALAILSGLLLTGSFPNVNINWLAWFAFVPLLISLRDLPLKESFFLGFLAGVIHYLTLVYWLIHTMRTYGHLPWHLSVVILILLSAYLALYFAVFSATLSRFFSKPSVLFIIIPVFYNPNHIPALLSSRLGVEFDFYDMERNVQELYNLILKKVGGLTE